MLARKRIDIGTGDLLRGVAWVALGPLAGGLRRDAARSASEASLGEAWAGERGLAALSVRSAFDLYLAARAFPAGSEVLMSGANIPDMARLVRTHDLVPVPIDFPLADLVPGAGALADRITSRTRAVVLAHLFGAVSPLAGTAELCRRHRLDLVEDRAQAFTGPTDTGHPEATLSLFSFGPIKSATALGGALVTVRDPALLARMRRLAEAWPVVPRDEHLARLVRYGGLSLLARRAPYTLLALACRLAGGDLDRWVGSSARSFRGDELLGQIRRRPSRSLLRLLARRLATASETDYERRAAAGRDLARRLGGDPGGPLVVPGTQPACHGGPVHHTFWVFPVLTDRPKRLVAALRAAGFDATRQATLAPLGPDLPLLTRDFSRLVYLPFDGLTAATRRRLAARVRDAMAR